MKRLHAILLAAACAFAAGAAHAEWIESWSASPTPPTPAGGPFPASPSFADQTLRQVVRLSAGGDRFRVRISNAYGAAPLRIGAATVALADESGAIVGEVIPLTFSGEASATAPEGAPLLSDPVELPVAALSSLSVSLYFPEDTGPCTCHGTGVQTGYVAQGDRTGGAFEAQETFQYRAFLSGVVVDTAGEGKTIVAFGDSITDGLGATPDTNNRWPDVLAERLAARGGDVSWGVSNAGISGNRLIADGAAQNILARMDSDVLAVPGVEYVVLFIGINDIGRGLGPAIFGPPPPEPLTLEAMLAGYRQVITRAHAAGLTIYGATVTPYGGVSSYSEAGEALRQAINDWIRTSGEFDGVLDFDAVVRDPADPLRMADGMHPGDRLHGSDAGYEAMVNSIDLSLFQ